MCGYHLKKRVTYYVACDIVGESGIKVTGAYFQYRLLILTKANNLFLKINTFHNGVFIC